VVGDPQPGYLEAMNIKQGRPRRFHLAEASDTLGPELSFQLGFLSELGTRVEDQVNHLPPEALNFVGPQSTLSIGRLVLHLAGADLTMLSKALGLAPDPGWTKRLEAGLLASFSAAPGDLSQAPALLNEYLPFREAHLLGPCRTLGFLDRSVDHAYCQTNRELLAHLVWHWSYHSGQIGLVALEAGFDYVWTAATKTS